MKENGFNICVKQEDNMENFKKLEQYLRSKTNGKQLRVDHKGHLILYTKVCDEMNCYTFIHKDNESFTFDDGNECKDIRYESVRLDTIDIREFLVLCYISLSEKILNGGGL